MSPQTYESYSLNHLEMTLKVLENQKTSYCLEAAKACYPKFFHMELEGRVLYFWFPHMLQWKNKSMKEENHKKKKKRKKKGKKERSERGRKHEKSNLTWADYWESGVFTSIWWFCHLGEVTTFMCVIGKIRVLHEMIPLIP